MNTTINLNLSRFFNDQRSFVNVFIDEKFVTVNDLRHYIKKTFGISKFCLLNALPYPQPHYLIPRGENIRILQGITNILVEPVSFKETVYKSNKLCKASLERQEGPPDVSMKEVEDEQSSSTGTHTTNPPYTTDHERRKNLLPREKLQDYENINGNEHSISEVGTSNGHAKTCLPHTKLQQNVEVENRNGSESMNGLVSGLLSIHSSESPAPEVDPLSSSKYSERASLNINSPALTKNLSTNKLPVNGCENLSDETNKDSKALNEKIVLDENDVEMTEEHSAKSTILIKSVESNNYPLSKIIEESDNTCINLQPCDNVTTRHRRRVRKRKSQKALTPYFSDKKNNEVRLQDSSEFSKDSISAKSTPSHIRFSDKSNDLENHSLYETENAVNGNASPVTNVINRPKVIENCQVVKESPNLNNKCENENQTAWLKLYEEFDPHEYESLKKLPNVGDIIACKILQMTPSYEPELSAYMFALVLDIVSNDSIQNSDIQLEVLFGNEFVQRSPGGKFELSDDNVQEPATSSVINLKWHNIYDPKLICINSLLSDDI